MAPKLPVLGLVVMVSVLLQEAQGQSQVLSPGGGAGNAGSNRRVIVGRPVAEAYAQYNWYPYANTRPFNQNVRPLHDHHHHHHHRPPTNQIQPQPPASMPTPNITKLGTAEEIRNTPRADTSIEQLAIETTGAFTASQSVYERLRKDIAAAKPILKEIRPSLAEITYWSPDDGKTLMIGADDDETFQQMISGEYEAWKDLNDWYGVQDKFNISGSILIRFKGIYNMKQLADIYSKLPGVEYAQSNMIYGDGSTIKVKMYGYTWIHYTFVEKWGDCPSGCTNSEEFYVTSTAPGAVRYAGSQRTRGEDSYGQDYPGYMPGRRANNYVAPQGGFNNYMSPPIAYQPPMPTNFNVNPVSRSPVLLMFVPTAVLNCPTYGRYSDKTAVVDLVAGSEAGVSGHLTLTAITFPVAGVRIQGKVEGLTPGKHGFHVHMQGNLTNQCKDSGGHFNPEGNDHSAPTALLRHAGDLGNVVSPPVGPTYIHIVDRIISLGDGGLRDVAGRAIVIHAGEDDLGLGGDDGSKKTGNAGSRAACGTIVLQ